MAPRGARAATTITNSRLLALRFGRAECGPGDMCGGCHGGPSVERSEIGKGLNPQAPDLADAVPAWSPRQLFWIVKNGLKMTGMPSFGKTHDDNQVWSIVAFIEQLPGMSYEQYQEMKRGQAAH
jgi:mono/diheme cytochrome c family protein